LLNKVDFDDKALHAGLVRILESGTFEIKGGEVELFARIMLWLKQDVGKMIESKSKGRRDVIKKD